MYLDSFIHGVLSFLFLGGLLLIISKLTNLIKFQRYLNKAEQGDVSAQVEVFTCYFTGTGVRKDEKQALYWLKNAANSNSIDAQTLLGILYKDGNSIERDLEQAIYWLQKAADQGGEEARELLESVKNEL